MSLQGTLEIFTVPEVLRLLAGTRKTGRLQVDGPTGPFAVDLRDGGIVAAAGRVPAAGLHEVLIGLLRTRSGTFAFDPEAPVGDGERHDVEDLLGRCEIELRDWTEVEAVVPDLGARVELRAELAGDVTLTPERWAQVRHVGEGRAVRDFAARAGLDDLAACRAICDLVDVGVVDVVPVPTVEVATPGGAWAAPVTVPEGFASELGHPGPGHRGSDDTGSGQAGPRDPERSTRVGSRHGVLDHFSPEAAAAVQSAIGEDVRATEPSDEDTSRDLLLRFLATTQS